MQKHMPNKQLADEYKKKKKNKNPKNQTSSDCPKMQREPICIRYVYG